MPAWAALRTPSTRPNHLCWAPHGWRQRQQLSGPLLHNMVVTGGARQTGNFNCSRVPKVLAVLQHSDKIRHRTALAALDCHGPGLIAAAATAVAGNVDRLPTPLPVGHYCPNIPAVLGPTFTWVSVQPPAPCLLPPTFSAAHSQRGIDLTACHHRSPGLLLPLLPRA